MSSTRPHQTEQICRQHFAAWAMGEINSNIKRAVLAEYLVANALGVLTENHGEWDYYDINYHGVKIEVKSSGFSTPPFWPTKSVPIPKFDIAERKWSWSNEIGDFLSKGVPSRAAEIYVFAATLGRDKESFDPFTPDGWTFCVAPTETLNKKYGPQKTVTFNSLTAHFDWVDANQLKDRVDRILGENT